MTNAAGTGMRQRVLELLSFGIPATAVAARLGVSDSLVSQLLADEDFKEALAAKMEQGAEEDQKFDQLLEDTETQALENISQKIKFGNLQASLQAFKVLNGARKRKEQGLAGSQGPAGIAVQISMPTVLMPVYVLNQKSEIVEVDGQTMVSASPKRMEEIARNRAETLGLALPLQVANNERAKEILEGVVRSVVRPERKQARRIPGTSRDLVDLL